MGDKNSAEDANEIGFMDSTHILTLFPCYSPLFLSLSFWYLNDPSVNAQTESLDNFFLFSALHLSAFLEASSLLGF